MTNKTIIVVAILLTAVCFCVYKIYVMGSKETKRNTALKLMNNSLKQDVEFYKESYRAHAQLNLRIYQLISDRELRRLRKDSLYLVLIDKVN